MYLGSNYLRCDFSIETFLLENNQTIVGIISTSAKNCRNNADNICSSNSRKNIGKYPPPPKWWEGKLSADVIQGEKIWKWVRKKEKMRSKRVSSTNDRQDGWVETHSISRQNYFNPYTDLLLFTGRFLQYSEQRWRPPHYPPPASNRGRGDEESAATRQGRPASARGRSRRQRGLPEVRFEAVHWDRCWRAADVHHEVLDAGDVDAVGAAIGRC